MIRRRVVVTGHVQGVFFRDTCRRVAEQHSVAGWVRNADDGAVEAELEGAPDNVAAVLAWVRHGPDQAQVSGVDVSNLDPSGDAGFAVR